MAKKNLKDAVKNFMSETSRPTNMQELFGDTEKSEETISAEIENRKIGKSENISNKKSTKPARYEVRPDDELDLRFRRYKLDTRESTNDILTIALDTFLKSNDY